MITPDQLAPVYPPATNWVLLLAAQILFWVCPLLLLTGVAQAHAWRTFRWLSATREGRFRYPVRATAIALLWGVAALPGSLAMARANARERAAKDRAALAAMLNDPAWQPVPVDPPPRPARTGAASCLPGPTSPATTCWAAPTPRPPTRAWRSHPTPLRAWIR